MSASPRFAYLAAVALLLAGCGNKGPLIQAPIPLQEGDASGASAAAVDAGAVADPPPTDETAAPVPPAVETVPAPQPPRSGDPRR